MTPETIYVWVDGSVTGGAWGSKKGPPEPVRCWVGWIAKTQEGEVIHCDSVAFGEIPSGSGNWSEYAAVSCALRWLFNNKYADFNIEVRSDSQLIINQLTGKFNVHDARMLKLRDHCREVAAQFPKVTYRWIPREKNREADALSKALQVPAKRP